jgi:protocatechuate 3,4-dioxygenase alpha subunit
MSGAGERLACLPWQTVGPFYHFGLTARPEMGCLIRHGVAGVAGERIRLGFRLMDGDGAAVPDGMLEIWQADAAGVYGEAAFCGFGRLATDDEGRCTFETIRPGRVPDGQGGWQASHINVSLFARGLLGRLCTRVYFDGDAALGEDRVLTLVPEERRHTLIAQADGSSPGLWRLDIRLQGEQETVFFDI